MACDRLRDKAVIVTGAASGIGRATAIRLAAEGSAVLAVDVAGEALTTAAAEACDAGGEHGGRAIAHVADVSDEAAAASVVDAAVAAFGGLDALCNIAGILRTSHTHECSLDLWEQVIGVNLTGTFLMCRAALPHLLERRGAIVNCSSTAASFGHPWMAAYAASKGGVAALTQTLAVEYAKQGLRVSAICPGSVDSGITRGIVFPDDIDDRLIRRIMSPTGPGRPEHVAGVVAMLISGDGAHLTGASIRIDGGTHA